jgi:probable phosphomutase (TIGR03848 family)
MSTVLFVRHGRTAANTEGVLAGWTAGVGLDERGAEQVAALSARLAELTISAVVTSPLQRCQETAQALLADRSETPCHTDDRLGEVRYGDWTGQPLKQLAKQKLWKTVQAHPSGVVFPGTDGEGLAAMQARSVAAVREWNSQLGEDAVYVVVSHGDVIKAVLADALGQHLDQFQRIVVDPASLSVVQYGATRPFVERTNDTGGSVNGLKPPKRRRTRKRADDAVVGGGAGS